MVYFLDPLFAQVLNLTVEVQLSSTLLFSYFEAVLYTVFQLDSLWSVVFLTVELHYFACF